LLSYLTNHYALLCPLTYLHLIYKQLLANTLRRRTHDGARSPFPSLAIMCKVKQYRFTCQHYLKVCISRCGGTKEKKTRSSAKAACCSEPYIYIKLCFACSKCQQDSWLVSWQGKRDRATAFRNGLQEKGLPGADEVTRLVKELEEKYASAAWALNQSLPHAHSKSHVERVKLALKTDTERKRRVSLLRREVQPQEVVLPADKKEGWIENDNNDDEDYVRSTDPLHPVCTDYSHPLDGIDDSWMLEHFTAEELQASAADNEFVIDHSFGQSWNWGGDKDIAENTAVNAWNDESAEASDSAELTAWGPEADTSSPPVEIGMNGIRTEEEKRINMIEETIKAFWGVVNGDSNIDINAKKQQPHHPHPSKDHLTSLLQILSLIATKPNNSDSSDSDPDSNLNTRLESPPIWTDGPANDEHARPLPRRPSTQLKYDKMRSTIQKYKFTSPRLYYSKWLLLSRMEIRDFVGPPMSWTIWDPK